MLYNYNFSTFTKALILNTFLMFLLSGCTLLKSSENSDVGDENIDILVLTDLSINPDFFGRPAPVRLDIFEMSAVDKFIYTNYLDLANNENVLNDALISKTQYILYPDNLKYLNYKIAKETKYLGVAVGFRNIEEKKWRLALYKQPQMWGDRFNKYLYLKIDETGIQQLSDKDMKKELKEYATKHPEDQNVSKSGRFKKPKYDYSKGVFSEQNNF